MRVVFMGTPDFAVSALEALDESEFIDLVGVVSQPDRRRGRGQKVKPTPVKKEALKRGIEVFQPKKVSTPTGLDKLKEWNPDIIVVVAYGQILKKEVLELPKYGSVNIHASLLPKHRGAAPIHRAIINGDEKTGITTMMMDEGLDTGDAILKEEVEITRQDTVGSLHDKLAQLGADLIVKTLEAINSGKASYEIQDSSKATYADKISKAEGEVDWSKDSIEIWNLIRGMNPWPGSYTYYEGNLLKLWGAKTYNGEKKLREALPGEVVKIEEDLGIIVQTGKGQLLLTKVQPASKKKISAADYVRGYGITEGNKLGES